jgi:hypothetical protein
MRPCELCKAAQERENSDRREEALEKARMSIFSDVDDALEKFQAHQVVKAIRNGIDDLQRGHHEVILREIVSLTLNALTAIKEGDYPSVHWAIGGLCAMETVLHPDYADVVRSIKTAIQELQDFYA